MSDLKRLRAALAKAEGQVRRYDRELEELRDEYRQADRGDRVEITRRGQHLHLVRDDAASARDKAWQALQAEERRLLQPGQFLRFT
jgi:hypothetical protein